MQFGSNFSGQLPAPHQLDFRYLLEKLPAAAYACDAEGLITYFNEHAVRLWGRAPRLLDPVDRFCGSFQLFTTDLRPIRHDQCWMALALQHNREYLGHEIVIMRPDGSRRIATAHANPFHDEGGQLSGAVNVLMDITDRREAEHRKEREVQIQQFMARAGEILASSLDYEATLSTVTRLCVPTLADWAFIDLIESDGTARRVAIACADEARAELADELSQVGGADHLANVKSFGAQPTYFPDVTADQLAAAASEAPFLRGLRTLRPTSFAVLPLHARGVSLGALTLLRAESGRRIEPEEYAVAKELVRRASLAVDNARLYQQAQLASHTKSEFLANMSHELRTPMTAVLGYADLLAARLTDPEDMVFLRTIKRNSRCLLEIINDILDLSKIEAGKIEIHRERFAVPQLIADIHSLMLVPAQEKNLTLAVHYASPLPATIESDPTRLRQILLNLIGNAIKFTETGGVQLIVKYHAHPATPRVQFDVVDTGIGISTEQRSRLFQPFSQGDASVTRKYGGTGLGLIISKRLAELLGGDITVESAPEQGSTFSVTVAAGPLGDIPLIAANEQADMAEPEPAQVRPQPRLACRVLVVDDRREVRHLARHILTRRGAEVSEAADGQAAIDAIQQSEANASPFDVVLLDMQMPTLDGYQTAARLRELGFRRPIIAVTADAMRGDRERCLEAGCNGYLAKPIDSLELLELVAKFAKAS